MIPYLVWIFFIDNAAEHGGRRWLAMRQWVGWKFFASYFPVSLIKVRCPACIGPRGWLRRQTTERRAAN